MGKAHYWGDECTYKLQVKVLWPRLYNHRKTCLLTAAVSLLLLAVPLAFIQLVWAEQTADSDILEWLITSGSTVFSVVNTFLSTSVTDLDKLHL